MADLVPEIGGAAAEIIIGGLATKIPGGRAFAPALGGAVGGGVGELMRNGWHWDSNVPIGALGGAVGAELGGRLSGYHGPRRLKDSSAKLKTAEKNHKDLDQRNKEYIAWDDAVNKKGRAHLNELNKEVTDAENYLASLRARKKPPPTIDEIRDAKQDLKDAKRERDAFKETLKSAPKQPVDADELKARKDKLTKAERDHEDLNAKFGDPPGKWAPGVMTGIGTWVGSMLARQLGGGLFGDEGAGEDTGAGGEMVPMTWAGMEAATAGEVWGTGPFTTSAYTAEGQGFLLIPTELTTRNPPLTGWYGNPSGSFAAALVEDYLLFGKAEKPADVTEGLKNSPIPTMNAVVPGQGAGGEGYKAAVEQLNGKAKELSAKQYEVLEGIKDVKKICEQGQRDIGTVITNVNDRIVADVTQPNEVLFLQAVSGGLALATQAIGVAADSMDQLADGINTPGMDDGTKEAGEDLNQSALTQDQAMADQMAKAREAMGGDLDAATDNLLDGLGDPSAIGDGLGEFGENAKDYLADQAENLENLGSQVQDGLGDALQNPATLPAAAGLGAMGGMGGVDMSSMLLPMILSQAMNRNMQRDMDDGGIGGDPGRYAREMQRAQALPATGTTPWTAQQAAATAPPTLPAAQSGPPTGATSTQPGGAAPRPANEKGTVTYQFPDGRTQEVTAIVKEALDKAFANKDTTDAKAAYEGTPAAWTDEKAIGDEVDGLTLATGAVGMWRGEKDAGADRYAIVVKWGDDPATGSLEAIVDGELRVLEGDMKLSDKLGEFGDFAGFRQPKGTVADTTQGKSGDVAVPAPEQSTGLPDLPVPAIPA